ncbi:MAG TPA: hypothetical protein VFW46_07770 [Stellaceae bacterium]|nr:hypothetical protein [Stellaceae bacterium]
MTAKPRDLKVLEELGKFHSEFTTLWYDQYEKAYRVRARAAPQKGTRFLLTRDEFWGMVIRARGRCQMTGQPFDRFYRGPTGKHPFIPTIDKVNPVGDYTADNCQLVTWISNVAVCDFGREAYMTMLSYGTAD